MADSQFDGNIDKYDADNPMRNLSEDQRAFIEEVAYYANKECRERKAAGQDWVLPSVCISQACLESEYGKFRTVNLFGITGGNLHYNSHNFQSYKGIEQDIHDYYDLICGTGSYKGSKLSEECYGKARNLADPVEALRIISVHYCPEPDYFTKCKNVLNSYGITQFDFSFDYYEQGYIDGCETCEALKKVINDVIDEIDEKRKNIVKACNKTPQVDSESFLKLGNLTKLLNTMKVLTNRIKSIADNEKYIAEEYSKDDDSLDAIQASDLALGISNYSIVGGAISMADVIAAYKERKKIGQFGPWFETYVTKNGVESEVVDMNSYTTAIKKSGATSAKNHVISELTDVDEESDTKKKDDNKKKTDDGKKKTDDGKKKTDDQKQDDDRQQDDNSTDNSNSNNSSSNPGSKNTTDTKNKNDNKKTKKSEDKKQEELEKKKQEEQKKKETKKETKKEKKQEEKKQEEKKQEDNKEKENKEEEKKVEETEEQQEDKKEENPEEQKTEEQKQDDNNEEQKEEEKNEEAIEEKDIVPPSSEIDDTTSYEANDNSTPIPEVVPETNTQIEDDNTYTDTSAPETPSSNLTNNLATPETENQNTTETPQTPSESTTKKPTIEKIPTPEETNGEEVKRDSNGNIIPILTGVAAAAVAAGGAYAIHKKNNNNEDFDEYDSEELEEDNFQDSQEKIQEEDNSFKDLESYNEEDEEIEGYQDDDETLPDEYK